MFLDKRHQDTRRGAATAPADLEPPKKVGGGVRAKVEVGVGLGQRGKIEFDLTVLHEFICKLVLQLGAPERVAARSSLVTPVCRSTV